MLTNSIDHAVAARDDLERIVGRRRAGVGMQWKSGLV
jgi:hypothetical protein